MTAVALVVAGVLVAFNQERAGAKLKRMAGGADKRPAGEEDRCTFSYFPAPLAVGAVVFTARAGWEQMDEYEN